MKVLCLTPLPPKPKKPTHEKYVFNYKNCVLLIKATTFIHTQEMRACGALGKVRGAVQERAAGPQPCPGLAKLGGFRRSGQRHQPTPLPPVTDVTPHNKKTLSKELEVTAQTKDGIIMGIRHIKYNVHGVQFHPESIKTIIGIKILKNFINYKS